MKGVFQDLNINGLFSYGQANNIIVVGGPNLDTPTNQLFKEGVMGEQVLGPLHYLHCFIHLHAIHLVAAVQGFADLSVTTIRMCAYYRAS